MIYHHKDNPSPLVIDFATNTMTGNFLINLISNYKYLHVCL